MNTARQRGLAVVVLLLAATVALVAAARIRGGTSHPPSATPQLARRVPDLSAEAQLRFTSEGVPELWIVSASHPSGVKVSQLSPGEGVRDNFIWSPRGSLLAFESYDLQGHSPLTTAHVWVVRATGAGLAKVSLQLPNDRFSTHIDGWIDDNALRIRATLVSEGDDVFYTFTYDNREVRRNPNAATP